MTLTWRDVLSEEKKKPYFQHILSTIESERQAGQVIYPANSDIFNAFKSTELGNIKVVILGQDPYHGPNQAHGLAFSVLPGVKAPPSLANMYKELVTDIEGFSIPSHGYLQSWAEQGVLLLNTVLTVQAGNAHSHAKLGWEQFTDTVVAQINEHTDGVVFMLWGSHAQKKGRAINADKHLILKTVHPSPLSAHRGFFGSKHFSTANQWLLARGQTGINWHLPQIV